MTKIVNDYDKEVQQFVDAMKYKLHANRKKGKWEGATLSTLFDLLRKEVDELEAEISSTPQNQIAIILESADIGNFAMIIANVALRMATGEMDAANTTTSNFAIQTDGKIERIVTINNPNAATMFDSDRIDDIPKARGITEITMQQIRARHAPHINRTPAEIEEQLYGKE